MADLEKLAIRRDRRFVWRLVLVLGVAGLVGAFLFAKLTSQEFGNCSANLFGAGGAENGAPADEPSSPE